MESTVRKDELLEKVQANRETHRAVFNDALEGFRQSARELLEEQLQEVATARKPKELRILLARPEDHTADYDRIITMLQMDTRTEITLSERLFANFVMDDWDWKRSWLKMSNRYAAASTQQAYGDIDDEE